MFWGHIFDKLRKMYYNTFRMNEEKGVVISPLILVMFSVGERE